MDAQTEYFEALQKGEAERLQAVLDAHPEVLAATTERGNSGIMVAIYYGHPELAEQLIARGKHLNLFEAAAAGQLERVRALVAEPGTVVDAYAPDGFTALGLAAFFGHTAVVEHLLAHGANPRLASRNSMQVAPVHSAAAHHRAEVALPIMRALLEHGADPNVAQEGGWTPLHEAAMHGREDLARLLLEHGADPHLPSADGSTPADLAARKGHAALADRLR